MKKISLGLLFLFIVIFAVSLMGCESTVKIEKVNGSQTVVVNAEGQPYKNGLTFSFDGESNGFTLDTPLSKSIHDSSKCTNCGYTEFEGKKAFHICNKGKLNYGFLFKFNTPIKASSFSGATIEFMTSKDAKKSDLRLLKVDESNILSVLNDEVKINGAASKWKSVNIGVKDFDILANSDGYIEGIQLFIKNSDNVDFYISELTFKINSESLCNIDIDSSCFYEKGAVEVIANEIKKNFENANLSAEIKVDCVTYLQNTSKDNGEITYNAEVTMSNGKYFSHPNITKVIPLINNDWLDNNDHFYGANQDSSDNWNDEFSSSGILSVTDHDISCLEGLKKVQYAVVSTDKDYKDTDIKWHDTQKLVFNKSGIKSMYINSFLDYGNELVNGQNYKMIIRTVTNNDNFIKNFEKSFTYKEYSSEKNTAIVTAFNKIKDLTINGNSNDLSEDFVKNEIQNIINDSKVSVIAKKKNVAGSTTTFDIALTYSDKEISNCYGDAFTLYNFKVWHNSDDLDSKIMLTAPLDGEKNIILASEYIYNMADTSYVEYTNVGYGYINAEKCTPPAVKLEWTDSSGAKEYTVFVSEFDNFSVSYEFKTKETSYDVYNLKVGTKYYWKVTSGDISSPVFTFETASGYPRFIKIDGVCNTRDLGGYITKDGKIVKQGLLYRSASLDKITNSAKNELSNMLNIKTDLDLRGETHTKSPLGNDVQIINEPLKWYHGIFNEEAEIVTARTVKYFADSNNYPIDFHCSLGRDRTGTLSIILLGLLGVDEETIFRDYHFSFFSQPGGFTIDEFNALQVNLSELYKHLAEYGGENASFNDRVEAYMLKIGVTQEEINTIREIMLEDAPVVEEVSDDKVVFDNSDDSSSLLLIIAIIVGTVIVIGIVVLLILLKKRRNKDIAVNS